MNCSRLYFVKLVKLEFTCRLIPWKLQDNITQLRLGNLNNPITII